MPYISQLELEDFIPEAELIQLTDDANTGSVDDDKVDAAIAAACSEIDAYAGVRYSLPLQASIKVKQLARDLAVWHLESRRRQIRDDTQKKYDEAMKFLRDLAAGKAVLDQPAGEPAQQSGAESQGEDTSAVFTDDNLDGF